MNARRILIIHLPSNTLSRINRQGITRLPHRSRGQAYQSPHASLEGVRLHARRIHRSFTAKQRRTRITGQGVTRLPNRSHCQAYQSPHNSLERETLNGIRISSFTAKLHTTRITGQGVIRLPQPFTRSSISKSTHFPRRSEVECKTDSYRSLPSNKLSRITRQGVTRLHPTIQTVKHIRVTTLPLKE